ncbi:MAG: ATP-binding protein [Candidatus Competibacteraceae bacterium]|nr:MAG: ATP-binding protein [Candidatus Competibacteraceae bacterium]
MNLTQVLISASIHPDGTLGRVEGLGEKLNALMGTRWPARIHTLVVARQQALGSQWNPWLHDRLGIRLIEAETLDEALALLQRRLGELEAASPWGSPANAIPVPPPARAINRPWLKQSLRAAQRTLIQRAPKGELARGYIWVLGAAGSGKSALLADFVTEERRRGLESRCAAFHFIRRKHLAADDPARFLPELTRQLYVFRGLEPPPYAVNLDPKPMFERGLAEAARGLERPVVIVIDALDESFGEGGRFARVGANTVLPDPAALPPGIILLVGSRLDEHDLAASSPGPMVEVRIGGPQAEQDIVRYIEKLNQQLALALEPELRRAIARRVRDNFMLVTELFRRAGAASAAEVESWYRDVCLWRSDPERIPSDPIRYMEMEWTRLVEACWSQTPAETRFEAERWLLAVLGLVCFARRALSPDELEAIVDTLREPESPVPGCSRPVRLGGRRDNLRGLDRALYLVRLARAFLEVDAPDRGISARNPTFEEFIADKLAARSWGMDFHQILAWGASFHSHPHMGRLLRAYGLQALPWHLFHAGQERCALRVLCQPEYLQAAYHHYGSQTLTLWEELFADFERCLTGTPHGRQAAVLWRCLAHHDADFALGNLRVDVTLYNDLGGVPEAAHSWRQKPDRPTGRPAILRALPAQPGVFVRRRFFPDKFIPDRSGIPWILEKRFPTNREVALLALSRCGRWIAVPEQRHIVLLRQDPAGRTWLEATRIPNLGDDCHTRVSLSAPNPANGQVDLVVAGPRALAVWTLVEAGPPIWRCSVESPTTRPSLLALSPRCRDGGYWVALRDENHAVWLTRVDAHQDDPQPPWRWSVAAAEVRDLIFSECDAWGRFFMAVARFDRLLSVSPFAASGDIGEPIVLREPDPGCSRVDKFRFSAPDARGRFWLAGVGMGGPSLWRLTGPSAGAAPLVEPHAVPLEGQSWLGHWDVRISPRTETDAVWMAIFNPFGTAAIGRLEPDGRMQSWEWDHFSETWRHVAFSGHRRESELLLAVALDSSLVVAHVAPDGPGCCLLSDLGGILDIAMTPPEPSGRVRLLAFSEDRSLGVVSNQDLAFERTSMNPCLRARIQQSRLVPEGGGHDPASIRPLRMVTTDWDGELSAWEFAADAAAPARRITLVRREPGWSTMMALVSGPNLWTAVVGLSRDGQVFCLSFGADAARYRVEKPVLTRRIDASGSIRALFCSPWIANFGVWCCIVYADGGGELFAIRPDGAVRQSRRIKTPVLREAEHFAFSQPDARGNVWLVGILPNRSVLLWRLRPDGRISDRVTASIPTSQHLGDLFALRHHLRSVFGDPSADSESAALSVGFTQGRPGLDQVWLYGFFHRHVALLRIGDTGPVGAFEQLHALRDWRGDRVFALEDARGNLWLLANGSDDPRMVRVRPSGPPSCAVRLSGARGALRHAILWEPPSTGELWFAGATKQGVSIWRVDPAALPLDREEVAVAPWSEIDLSLTGERIHGLRWDQDGERLSVAVEHNGRAGLIRLHRIGGSDPPDAPDSEGVARRNPSSPRQRPPRRHSS